MWATLINDVFTGCDPAQTIAKLKFDAAFGALEFIKEIRTAGSMKFIEPRKNKTGEDEDVLTLGQANVNIDKIEVKVISQTLDDPNRVAIAFDQILSRANEFRAQARSSPFAPKPI